jgi:hypothetical protein
MIVPDLIKAVKAGQEKARLEIQGKHRMNERIKQLALQAGATLEKGYIELSDGQLMLSDNVELDKSNMDLEKFAELIVKECTTAIIQDGRLNDVRSAANGCVRTIREHFGVEE